MKALGTLLPKPTAAQLAASIPGLKLGLSASEIEISDDSEDVATRPWLPELIQAAKRGELDPGDGTEYFLSLYGGPFKPPKGWSQWSIDKRAAYLDEHAPLEALNGKPVEW